MYASLNVCLTLNLTTTKALNKIFYVIQKNSIIIWKLQGVQKVRGHLENILCPFFGDK